MSEQAPDARRQEKAREYARITRRLFLVELAIGAVFLLVFLFSGLSTGLRDLLDFPQPARVVLYFLILLISYGIISFPLGFYAGFILPHRYGLSIQSLRSWLADEAKSGALASGLGTSLVLVVYLLLGAFPKTWWLLAFVFVALVSVLLTNLAPVLILPLFYKTEPLADSELRQRLLSLARRSGTRIKDVFQIKFSSKTTGGNAMLIGWGNTRRIVLSDTMLQRYTPEEIEVVMAHELGHHRHGDIFRLMLVQSALMLLGFYLVNLTLNWAVPRLVLAAFALVLMPLINAYSRHVEESADRFSLVATGNPEAFAAMLTKLTDQNLSESLPSRWAELLFYDHPPYYRRLELARRYQGENKK
jgi:STE24 endopeptidase